MKTSIIFSLLALIIWPVSVLKSQQQAEQLNLPGDNLNLYAVMKLFQESETLELFEKTLNEQDARVNNLDLNGDNYIDYIQIKDYVERNVHYIVLQVAVTPNESQDVAVFVVKKDANGQVIIQLIGDEALYGKYYIVEPYYDTDQGSTPNPGYYGNYGNEPSQVQTVVVHRTTYYEVASWPLIRFIFLPTYVAWHSPWYWGYYPGYWRPWTPWYWHQYYGYHYYWHGHYYGHYHHGHGYRFDHWNDHYYGPRRMTSTTVSSRQNRGAFMATYSKPELIREGSASFRKAHPDQVKPGMKEPDVKEIRVAQSIDRQSDKSRNPVKVEQGRQDERVPDRAQPVSTDGKTGGVKPERVESKSDKVKPQAVEGRPAEIKKESKEKKSSVQEKKAATTEKKTSGVKTEKSKPAKPEPSKPSKPAKSESKKEAVKESTKTSRETKAPEKKR